MKGITRITLAVASIATLTATRDGTSAVDRPDHSSLGASAMHLGAIELKSAGVMYFAPNGTLFLADPRSAAVYAIDVAEPYRDTTKTAVRIDDVDGKIAAALGTTRDQIHIVDMIAHPLVAIAVFLAHTREGERRGAARRERDEGGRESRRAATRADHARPGSAHRRA